MKRDFYKIDLHQTKKLSGRLADERYRRSVTVVLGCRLAVRLDTNRPVVADRRITFFSCQNRIFS